MYKEGQDPGFIYSHNRRRVRLRWLRSSRPVHQKIDRDNTQFLEMLKQRREAVREGGFEQCTVLIDLSSSMRQRAPKLSIRRPGGTLMTSSVRIRRKARKMWLVTMLARQTNASNGSAMCNSSIAPRKDIPGRRRSSRVQRVHKSGEAP